MGKTHTLNRTTFSTSRLLDFCNRKELIAQTGHEVKDWPLVIVKELVDNAIDACEEAGVAPHIRVHVDWDGIVVEDNGPGIPESTIEGVLDFSRRVSNRERYVSPTRGAQGNALKTIVAMPFVLDGDTGTVHIESHGKQHKITLRVDPIRQEPVFEREEGLSDYYCWPSNGTENRGTRITIKWPDSACLIDAVDDDDFLQIDDDSPSSILMGVKSRFLQFAEDYTFVNPHLTLYIRWRGDERTIEATNKEWKKWLPSDPTSPHWYSLERFNWLVAGYIGADRDSGTDRTVRELVSEFRGFSGSAKQKKVLDDAGVSRRTLASLVKTDGTIDSVVTQVILSAMQDHSRPVKPLHLGLIGRDHLYERFASTNCVMDTFTYQKVVDETDGVPWVAEIAFGMRDGDGDRRMVTGVNWSPGIINPFRKLGKYGEGLDGILKEQRSGPNEPITFFLHLACPRVEYTDRGKSALVIGG